MRKISTLALAMGALAIGAAPAAEPAAEALMQDALALLEGEGKLPTPPNLPLSRAS